MLNHAMCELCNQWKPRYVAVQPIISSMGGRKSRIEKAVKRLRVCRTCFNGPKFARVILAQIRETAKAVTSEARAAEWDEAKQ
jgi:hypothetical protein